MISAKWKRDLGRVVVMGTNCSIGVIFVVVVAKLYETITIKTIVTTKRTTTNSPFH